MKTIVEEGRVLKISAGEYEDNEILGFYKVIKSFNWQNELVLFKKSKKIGSDFSPTDFWRFLLRKEYIKEIPYDTLYLGSYGFSEGVNYWQH